MNKNDRSNREGCEPYALIELRISGPKVEGIVIDWSPWERNYREKLGVELTEADKLEIKSTVPAFFQLLKEIGQKVTDE